MNLVIPWASTWHHTVQGLHDPEQIKHAEMEDDENRHCDEHCGVFAFFKDLLQH
jgi:hypothetical protein